MTKPRALTYLAMFSALVVAPLIASAGPAEEAQKHMERAMKAHEDGKFALALSELETAYKLDPQPELLFAIGQVNVKLDKCDEAIRYYEKFLATNPGPQDTEDTKQAIATCKATQATTSTAPVSGDPATTTTTSTTTTTTTPPPTDPGAATPGLEGSTSARGSAGTSVGASAVRPWYTDRIGDALVATGVVTATVGLVVYASARSDISDAANASSYSGYRDLIDSGHTKRTYSILLVGSGLAITGAGVAHYLLHDRHAEVRGVGMVPAAGGGVVTWMGRF